MSKYQIFAWVAVIFTMIARELIRYGKATPKEEPLQEPQEDELSEVPEESPEDPDPSEITEDEGDADVQGGSNSQTDSL